MHEGTVNYATSGVGNLLFTVNSKLNFIKGIIDRYDVLPKDKRIFSGWSIALKMETIMSIDNNARQQQFYLNWQKDRAHAELMKKSIQEDKKSVTK